MTPSLSAVNEVFRGGDEETGGKAGGVADPVFGRGGGHFHLQLDNLAWGVELTVLASAGDLADHVYVEVALGVSVDHVDGVELVDDVGECLGGGHHEGGVLHVVAVSAVALAAGLMTGRGGAMKGKA